MFPATNKRPRTHQRKRNDLEYSIQENPRKQRKKGGGKGEEGELRSPSLNEPGTSIGRCDHVRLARRLPPLTAAVTYRHEPAWNSIGQQVLANNFGVSLLRPLWARTSPGRGDNDKPPLDGSTIKKLCGLIPGWHGARHTYRYAYGTDSGATRRPKFLKGLRSQEK